MIHCAAHRSSIVDDEELYRRALERILVRSGHTS
jgi:hypothetical protein